MFQLIVVQLTLEADNYYTAHTELRSRGTAELWPTQSYDLTESNIDTLKIEMILDNNNDPVDEEELPEAEGMEEDDMDAEEEEMTEDEAAEFSLLNQQLDQLDQALDAIEQKNDSIHSQLRELLQESKQARLELEADAKKQ